MSEYESIERLTKDLGLPKAESYTQDWAYEVPDEYRTESYLEKYITAYKNPEYNESDKKLLMQLMLDIINDFINYDEDLSESLFIKVLTSLKEEHELHEELIEHWLMEDEDDLENVFALTPVIRELFNK